MDYDLLKANFSRYTELTPAELTQVCTYYQERHISKGEYVLRKGEVCRFEGFVVKGCFRVFTIDDQGNERILYFAAEDWWIMEIDSFINQTASELSVQAIEESTILYITYSAKQELYNTLPKVERLFRIMSQTAVAAWQRRLIRNHSMDAEQRYHHFITAYPEIARRITNRHIASYLGITPEFVSKIRKRRLSNKG